MNFDNADLEDLVELLHDAIVTNNSVGFLLTTTKSELLEFWRAELDCPANSLVCARADGRIIGVVILTRETRPNGRHRAELRKLIVHSRFQRLGIGKDLSWLKHGVLRFCNRFLSRTRV